MLMLLLFLEKTLLEQAVKLQKELESAAFDISCLTAKDGLYFVVQIIIRILMSNIIQPIYFSFYFSLQNFRIK